MAVADGDLVMVHGRYTGWGPNPMVAVDIFRVADGKVVEHWDVMQEEVPARSALTADGADSYYAESWTDSGGRRMGRDARAAGIPADAGGSPHGP